MRLTVAAVAALALASCGYRVEGVSCSKNGDCASGQCLDGVCLVGDPDTGPAGEDAAAPGRDAAAPGRDAAAPGPDAALPGPDAGPVNRPPKIEVESLPERVPEGSLTPLVVKAADPDGDRVTLTWTDDPRLLPLPNGRMVFVAPDVEVDTEYALEVSACDPLAACDHRPLKLIVDRPPKFTAPAKVEPAIAAPNGKVDVTIFPDDPGDTLTFTWKLIYGRGLPETVGTTTSPSVSFQAPSAGDQTLGIVVEACGLLPLCTSQTFTVTVQDPQATTGAYVSSTGDDVEGKGTRAAPWKTIGRGLQEAKDRGLPQVFVAAGAYDEDVSMVRDIAVECGWNSTDWTRSMGETVIRPKLAAGLRFLAGQHARLDGCTVRPNPETTASEPAIAVSVVNATALIVGCTLDPSPEIAPSNTQGLSVNVAADTPLPPTVVAFSKVRGGNGTTRTAAVVKGGAKLEAWGTSFGDPAQAGATSSSGLMVRESAFSRLLLCNVHPGAAVSSAYGVVVEGSGEAQLDHSTVNGGKAQSTTAIGAGGAKVVVQRSWVDGGEGSNASYGIAGQSKDLQVTGNPLVSGGKGGASYGVKVVSGSALVSGNLRIDGGAGVTATGIAIHGGTGSVVGNVLVRGTVDALIVRPTNSYGLSLKSVTGVRVEDNLYVHGGEGLNNSTGIEAKLTTNLVVKGNTVFAGKGTTSWALIDRGTVASTGLRVEANTLVGGDATDATISGGVLFESTTSGVLLNNRVWGGLGPSATAFHLAPGALDVFNNAFMAGGKTGPVTTAHAIYVVAGSGGASTATRWHNNILDGGRVAGKRWAVYELGALTPASFRSNDFYPDTAPNYVAWRTAALKDLKVSDLAGISAAFADNFAEVPQFVNEAKGDLHLGPTSPCRDRGVPVEKGAAATDMDGDERPKVGPTDVGPDEVP